MNFSFKVIDNHLLISVAIVCLTAFGLTLGAFNKLADTLHGASNVEKQVQKIDNLPKITRNAAPMDAGAIAPVVQRLSILHPAVKISVSDGGKVHVSIISAEFYSEWRAAIADLLQADLANSSIETVSICGANCQGAYCEADFIIRRVKYEIT